MELLRLSANGSVDDGKSTLIGRLLYDSHSLFEEQVEEVRRSSGKLEPDRIDFSFFTDGLRQERERKITLDVAYKYFRSGKRKFILADTPGHFNLIRNMISGTSTAGLSLILIDAQKGITEQTKRHVFIASLLKVKQLIVCINKMDLVNFEKKLFEEITEEFRSYASKLELSDIHFLPVCSLYGDNLVQRSERMKWYSGTALINLLEDISINHDVNRDEARLPVQYVIEEKIDNEIRRTYPAGRIASGIFRKGDRVKILPSGKISEIIKIQIGDRVQEEARAGQSVTFLLSGDHKVKRGDTIVEEHSEPPYSQNIEMMLCWLDERHSGSEKTYLLRLQTQEVSCRIKEILYKVEINSLAKNETDKDFGLNDIGCVRVQCDEPLIFDSYRKNKITGSVILIDPDTNETVAAGMISGKY